MEFNSNTFYIGRMPWQGCGGSGGARKITNADRIRAMTDEELADYLRYYSDSYARYDMDWLDWLKEEAKDGE